MSEQPQRGGGPDGMPGTGGMNFPDPFAWWKQLYEANEETWARSMEQAMGTNAFAQAMGHYMQSFLELQDLTRRSMERYLETLNVPSRTDVARIAEQVVALEAKIDDLDFKTDELVARAGAAGGERLAALDTQVRALDQKLDRVLAMLEQGREAPEPAPQPATGAIRRARSAAARAGGEGAPRGSSR